MGNLKSEETFVTTLLTAAFNTNQNNVGCFYQI